MKRIVISILIVFQGLLLRGQDLNDYILRASSQLERDLYSEAISSCKDGLLTANDYRLHSIKGEAELEAGFLDEAESSFQMVNSLAPAYGDYGLARVYSLMNNPGLSVSHLEKHLRSEYKISRREIILNPYLASLESSEEWKQLWNREWYTDLEEGLSEAKYLKATGRLDELKDLLDRLEPVYDGEADMAYLEAVYYMARDDAAKALSSLREAINGGSTDAGARKDYLEQLIENKLYSEAIAVSDEARKVFPEESDYILYKAQSLRKLGDRENALKEVELYIELFPGDEMGLSLAGDILYEKKSYSEALKYFSQNIVSHPGNPDHYIKRANVYSATSTWQYAVYDYSMALDLKPHDGNVYYSKGMALLKTGSKDDACRDFRMALKYGNKKASAQINKNCIR